MRHLSFAAVIAAASLLVACSGGTQTSTSTQPQGESTAAVTQPHYGGQLRVGAVAAADTVLPIFAHSEGSTNDLGFMYDTLVNVDPDFNVVPWLAEKWEISKDALTYTFHLRKNATWSDGVPLTADDQVFEFELAKNPAVAAPYGADYDIVASVTAPDKYTVVYTLKERNAAFLSSVVAAGSHAPMPRHVYGKIDPAQLSKMDFSKNLVVSGSYTLKEWKHDDHLTLESNKHWWHGRPYIDEIYIKEYQSNPAVLIALQHGDVDISYFLSTPMWLAVRDDARYNKIHNPADQMNWYVVNHKNPILADLQVRKAIMYGWDRKSEAEKLFHGEDVPAESPIPWAQKWAFDPATEQAYPYDPAKAGQLLDADGWKMGSDGYRHRAGQLLTFRTGEIAGSEIAVKSFELFQANMKSIGIKTDMTALEFNVFYQREKDGDFDLNGGGFGGGADPDPFIFLYSKSAPPSGLNYGRYANPRMDDLIMQARHEPDQAKRATLYKQLQQLYIDDLPDLTDNMPYYRNVLNKRILGFDTAKAGSFFVGTMYHEPEWYVAQ